MTHPLVVDLDGTLLRTDILLESAIHYFKHHGMHILILPFWLIKGKANLKTQLAERVTLDVTSLPYNESVLAYLEQEKSSRPLVLATASHRIYAKQIASHLKLFDQVLATDQHCNLSSERKRERLVALFGERGFDYMGNSYADLDVWHAAEEAILVDPDPGLEKHARKQGNVAGVINSRNPLLKTWLRALRPHQWLKNLLLFIPLLASHEFFNLGLLLNSMLAFVLFSMSASSGYLFNDLLDLDSDRHHPRKKNRPLASGKLSLSAGIISAPLLFLAALGISVWSLPVLFTVILALYFLLTLFYSQWLKQIMSIDTIVLATLYTLRILGGAFACHLIPSFWILAFSVFLFLSLAMVKRYAELFDNRSKGISEKTRGRGYFPADLDIISNLGSASGYLSVMVLALYIQDDKTIRLYQTPEILWLACPVLLFWISRVWILAHRGEMHDDPVLFAVKDKISLLSGAAFALIFMSALML